MTNVNYKASNLILNKLLSGKAVTVSQLSLLTSLSYKAVRELLAEINAELVRRQLIARRSGVWYNKRRRGSLPCSFARSYIL